MSKFILLYKGLATDMSEMSEEQGKAIMDGWKSWMGRIGAALTDIGAPMKPGIALVDDGSERNTIDLSGYSIIEAKNIETAKGLAHDHPFLSEGKGNFSVEVFELMPAPF